MSGWASLVVGLGGVLLRVSLIPTQLLLSREWNMWGWPEKLGGSERGAQKQPAEQREATVWLRRLLVRPLCC